MKALALVMAALAGYALAYMERREPVMREPIEPLPDLEPEHYLYDGHMISAPPWSRLGHGGIISTTN